MIKRFVLGLAFALGLSTVILHRADAQGIVKPGGGSVTVPGSNTQAIFNDSGVLGADAGLTYNKTTDVLTVGSSVTLGTDALTLSEFNSGFLQLSGSGAVGLYIPNAQLYASSVVNTAVVFGSLPSGGAAINGMTLYCSTCTIANPCASGGTGAIAKRLNGVWVCN